MSSDEQSPQSAVTDPVGQQLRRARERLGLGLSDIADQQHLRSSVIQAIEDGDYQKIDTELFLKGYVRAYAKHVGLDADAVIRDLDAELEPARQQREQELEANPLVDIERKKRRKRQVARVFVVLLLIGLVAGGVAYYVSGTADQGEATGAFEASEGTTPAQSAPEVPEPASVDSASDVAGVSDVPAESPDGPDQQTVETEPDTPAVGDLASSPPEDEEPGNEMAEAAAAPETELEPAAATGAPELSGSDVLNGAEQEEPTLTAEEVSQVVQTPDPALTQQAVLEEEAPSLAELAIRFRGDCWVQVSDASGNRLASSLQRDGNELVVTGEAPLRVVIGAVSAVESIEFQGDALDLSDFRVVNNRAEFSLAL